MEAMLKEEEAIEEGRVKKNLKKKRSSVWRRTGAPGPHWGARTVARHTLALWGRPWAPPGPHSAAKIQIREFRVSTPYISFLTPPSLSPSPICTKIRWLCQASLKISQTYSSHFHFHDISTQIFHIFFFISISSSIFTTLLLHFIPPHHSHFLGRFWAKFLSSFHERLSSWCFGGVKMVNCFNSLHRGVSLVPCSFIVYLGYVVAIPCVFWVETWFYLSICYGLISYVLDTMFVCQMLCISLFPM